MPYDPMPETTRRELKDVAANLDGTQQLREALSSIKACAAARRTFSRQFGLGTSRPDHKPKRGPGWSEADMLTFLWHHGVTLGRRWFQGEADWDQAKAVLGWREDQPVIERQGSAWISLGPIQDGTVRRLFLARERLELWDHPAVGTHEPLPPPTAPWDQLVLQAWSGDDGLLYPLEDEKRVIHLMEILHSSSSWEELRKRLPAEFAASIDLDDGESSGEPYDPSHVDLDGERAGEMLISASERLELPAKITRRFLRITGSPAAGSFRFYSVRRADELREALEEAGFSLMVRDDFEPPWL